MKKRPRAGDVLIAKVPDGRYIAVRVLRVYAKTWVIETTEYLDLDRPSLDDPRLRRAVAQHRGNWGGKPARTVLEGAPTDNFELLGSMPLTEAEASMECNVYSGKWYASAGREAYDEWRWIHDREGMREEWRQRDAESKKRKPAPQRPKKMLDEDAFWSIISLLDWTATGDNEKVLAPAIAALAEKSTLEIRRFEERLAYLLYQLDTRAHATGGVGAEAKDSDQLSPDEFLYARCVIVANGRDFYESVLRDPGKMLRDLEFEALLEVATRAYELKTGEGLDYETGCSYESFSNPDGWA
jgi:hypothetical protein